jgi:hypothetical protein
MWEVNPCEAILCNRVKPPFGGQTLSILKLNLWCAEQYRSGRREERRRRGTKTDLNLQI